MNIFQSIEAHTFHTSVFQFGMPNQLGLIFLKQRYTRSNLPYILPAPSFAEST
jgi:hypothetical protein